MKTKLLLLSSLIALGFSTNAQSVWSPQASGFNAASRGINSIVALDSSNAWAVAYDGFAPTTYIQELTHTNNGGTLWTEATITGGTIATFGIANVSAINYDTAWVCMFDPNAADPTQGIYQTTDAGATWAKVVGAAYGAGSFPDNIYFWNRNDGIAIGDPIGGYYENYTTSDGGANWTRNPNTASQLNPQNASEYALTNVFDTYGGTIWYGTTHGRIFKSTDKGTTWTVANTPWFTTATNPTANSVSKIRMVDAMNGLAARYNSTTKRYVVARTTDGGATWNALTTSGAMFAADFDNVPGTSLYVSVGSSPQYHGSSMSNDGGATWLLMEDTTVAVVGTLIQRTAVAFADAKTGWSGTFNIDNVTGGMYKWTDSVAIVGINNNTLTKNQNIGVYPNPATDLISINLKGFENKNTEVKIFNMMGELVYESSNVYQTPIYTKHINISNLTAGVYLLSVTDGNGKYSQRIIKQ